MKLRTHSGTKKRIKVRKSGKLMVQKTSRKHLLADKSKRQKHLYRSGMPVTATRLDGLKKLIPGKVHRRKVAKRNASEVSK